MNEHIIRWEDLRIVLAIAESGSLSGAGRTLGMSHATVFRRLNDMERSLGVTLFERHRTGYSTTVAGADLAASATRVRDEILAAERRLAGQDLTLSGSIRITTTDSLFAGLLSPLFRDFRDEYPDIELEVLISNQLHSLTRREADIAIRPTNRPPDTLVGKHPGNIRQAVYGQVGQWSRQSDTVPVTALANQNWIGPDAHMGDTLLERWMAADSCRTRVRYRLDSILGMQQAVQQGAGIAVLPCYLADQDATLKPLTAPVPELTMDLWMLTHPDLRRVARIRTFLEVIGDGLRRVLAAPG